MHLIVTIPAFNEEETLADVIRSVPKKISGINKIEILVWNDGSTDNTANVAKKAGAHYVFSNKRNLGLARTFDLATRKAVQLGADIVVNTDADNQYNQKEITKLITPIVRDKADVVSGNRQVEKLNDMQLSKKIGNIFGSWVIRKLTGLSVKDASSGFRAYSSEAINALHIFSRHTYTHETLVQIAFSDLTLVEIPISFVARQKKSGKSRLISGVFSHIFKSGSTIIRTLVTYKAFKIIFFASGILLFIGMIGFIRFFYFFLQGNDNKIYSLLFAIFFSLSSVNLGVLALISDMIHRQKLEKTI